MRILNLAKNRLTHLPPVNENQDLNKVQELYLSNNHFGSSVMEVVSGYPRLKILHLAQNELMELCDRYLCKARSSGTICSSTDLIGCTVYYLIWGYNLQFMNFNENIKFLKSKFLWIFFYWNYCDYINIFNDIAFVIYYTQWKCWSEFNVSKYLQ